MAFGINRVELIGRLGADVAVSPLPRAHARNASTWRTALSSPTTAATIAVSCPVRPPRIMSRKATA